MQWRYFRSEVKFLSSNTAEIEKDDYISIDATKESQHICITCAAALIFGCVHLKITLNIIQQLPYHGNSCGLQCKAAECREAVKGRRDVWGTEDGQRKMTMYSPLHEHRNTSLHGAGHLLNCAIYLNAWPINHVLIFWEYSNANHFSPLC